MKLIIFDLDGTLVDSKNIHFISLNKALFDLDEKYVISKNEEEKYNGLPTIKKLEKLTLEKNLPVNCYEKVWKSKQEYTYQEIIKFTPDNRIIDILKELRKKYTVYVASNCTWKNTSMILLKKGFLEHIDYFISADDVSSPKPSPEIYNVCMKRAKCIPEETIIVEDSFIGIQSAMRSGGRLIKVESPNDITLKMFVPIKIVIPMSGQGSRFAKEGYKLPKPLIEIFGKPMIQFVVENIKDFLQTKLHDFIFIVQEEHYEKYSLETILNSIAPSCKIVKINKQTEGACCSVLLAKDIINTDEHMMIVNSDQFVEWKDPFFYSTSDGEIAVFNATETKWSYVEYLENTNIVKQVAEKKVISNVATVGMYYYSSGKEFVKYAEKMIEKNIRTNNEFYVCPVFNEFINDGKIITTFPVKKMWSLGTPEDLEYFKKNFFNS